MLFSLEDIDAKFVSIFEVISGYINEYISSKFLGYILCVISAVIEIFISGKSVVDVNYHWLSDICFIITLFIDYWFIGICKNILETKKPTYEFVIMAIFRKISYIMIVIDIIDIGIKILSHSRVAYSPIIVDSLCLVGVLLLCVIPKEPIKNTYNKLAFNI